MLLLLTGCRADGEAPPVPARTEQAMALLPPHARVAGMVDLQDLQNNGGIAFSSERGITVRFMDSDVTFNPLSAEQQDRLDTFIAATGFEPGTDLHAAYAASDSLYGQTFLLAADVDRDRLLDELEAELDDRIATTPYRSVSIVTVAGPVEGDAFSFAMLDDGWIALSANRDAVEAIVDRARDDDATTPSALSPLVQQVAGRGGAWAIARRLPAQQMARSPDDRRLRQLVQGVRDAATALHFEGDGVTGTVLLATDRDPGDLADVVRGLVSAVKLRETLTEEQRHFLDRVRVTERSGYVWVDFNVDQATLARLLIETMQSPNRAATTVAIQ